eukprot:2923891-Amphidinium_carterae.1
MSCMSARVVGPTESLDTQLQRSHRSQNVAVSTTLSGSHPYHRTKNIEVFSWGGIVKPGRITQGSTPPRGGLGQASEVETPACSPIRAAAPQSHGGAIPPTDALAR